ncbi:MAG: hypothetical protein HYS89_02330 [Candidatus Colwellbacteria bacterium]|nr:hypothetical protein [Candidatus Colwellbacteria bacterium]
MIDLFLELALVISLGAIVYLMAIAVPRVGEEEAKSAKKNGRSTNLPLEDFDLLLKNLRDKLLRRTKIVIMKIDNFLSRKLKREE